MFRESRLRMRRLINTVKVLRSMRGEIHRVVVAGPRERPLQDFFHDICQPRGCSCRACVIAGGGLGIVELARMRPSPDGAIATPAQEAEGLMRAAALVLMHAHLTSTPGGVKEIHGDAVLRDVSAVLGQALTAVHLSVNVATLPITAPKPKPTRSSTPVH